MKLHSFCEDCEHQTFQDGIQNGHQNRLFNQIISNNDQNIISVLILKACSNGSRQSSMFAAT